MDAAPAALGAQVAGAALAGMASSFGHCLGMCGPLVVSLGLAGGPTSGTGRRGSLARTLDLLPYHLGRISTYGLLGAVMGATGAYVNVAGRLAGLSDVMAVVAGLLMVVLGLGAAGVARPLRRLEAAASARVLAVVRPLLDGGAGRTYPLGLALGVLPCGVSWTIFLGASASGGAVPGLLMALAFGAATLPGLLLLGALGSLLGQRGRGLLARLSGVTIALLGLLFLLRGLGVHAPL
jgi:uncharacterized protein